MATNVFPALNVQPPQQQDLLGQFGKVVALKNMLQQSEYQQQMQPIQLEEAQTQLGILKRQQQSYQAMGQALNDDPHADIQDIADTAVKKYGANWQDVFPWIKQVQEVEKQHADLQKAHADNASTVTNMEGQMMGMLLNTDPSDRVRAFNETVVPAYRRMGITPPPILPSEDQMRSAQNAALRVDQQLKTNLELKQYNAEHGVIDENTRNQINASWLGAGNRLNIPQDQIPQLAKGDTIDEFKERDKAWEPRLRAEQSIDAREQARALRMQAMAIADQGRAIQIGELAKPNNDETRRGELADNLDENLNKVVDVLQRRPDLFGKYGWKYKLGTLMGSSDPDIKILQGVSDQMGIAKVATHGMRNAQAAEKAADAVLNGMKDTPEAMYSGIQTAMDSAQAFRDATAKSQRERLAPLVGAIPANTPAGQVLANAMQQTAPPAVAPGSMGTISAAKVAEAAQAHGMTYSQALRDATRKGYKVIP